jgi:hypothetical protein
LDASENRIENISTITAGSASFIDVDEVPSVDLATIQVSRVDDSPFTDHISVEDSSMEGERQQNTLPVIDVDLIEVMQPPVSSK